MTITHFPTCAHRARPFGRVRVSACPNCGEVTWSGPAGPIDPTEGLAALFGDFDLIDRLPAIHAPGPEVLLCRPSTHRTRERLNAFEPYRWWEAAPGLWLSHDGEHLMLATDDPIMWRNVAAALVRSPHLSPL